MRKTLLNKTRVAKATSLVAVLGLTLVALGSNASAWGPERTTYTNEKPADYATFNSITNNVAVGDERNFVRVRELGKDDTYTDEVEVTPGKEYEVYLYYHNNAATNTNESGYGVATNARMASAYPTKLMTGERGMISGILSWSYVTQTNNNPQEGKVWDEAYLTTKTDGVVLRYKTGSAKIFNSGATNNSVLPTMLFTEGGTPLGFNKLAGTLPGCAEYSGHITYTLVAEKTDLSMEKLVSVDGENWAKEVTVKPGDFVTYKVIFKNTGNTKFTNVIFTDSHDEGLSLRPGSTKVYDMNNADGKTIDDIIDISGYNTGDADAGALVQVIYQSQVSWDESVCNKSLKNTIKVAYNSDQEKTDDATVLVACDEPDDPDDPDNPSGKTCATNPEMEGCKELPNTGPVEIIMATIIVIGIGGGGYYLYRTNKTLKTVEENVAGKADLSDAKPEKKTDADKPKETKE